MPRRATGWKGTAMPKTDEERLAELEARKAQIEARMKAIQARKRERTRKADTRRKIILGSLLLDDAAHDPRAHQYLLALLRRVQRPADRRAFEGWQPPAPPPDGGG